jgi:hypothetical protein
MDGEMFESWHYIEPGKKKDAQLGRAVAQRSWADFAVHSEGK